MGYRLISRHYLAPFWVCKNMVDYQKRKIRARNIQKSLLKKPTLSELKFKDILDEMGIKYKFQKKIFTTEKFYIADFYIPKEKFIFEVDGGVHNDSFEYDKNREIDILKSGGKIKLIARFPNETIKDKNLVRKTIKDLLNKQGEFYQGLIRRKSDLLNKISAKKDKEKRKRKFLKDQLEKRPHLKSRLTKIESEIIPIIIGSDVIKPCSIEETSERTGYTKNRVLKAIGKLYWLIKTD